jgi:hypothetical protein
VLEDLQQDVHNAQASCETNILVARLWKRHLTAPALKFAHHITSCNSMAKKRKPKVAPLPPNVKVYTKEYKDYNGTPMSVVACHIMSRSKSQTSRLCMSCIKGRRTLVDNRRRHNPLTKACKIRGREKAVDYRIPILQLGLRYGKARLDSGDE